MDLRNLCSKVDVDAIRAKIPPLPQMKLPKSMSKLKSRKIFRSSREDVSSDSRRSSSKRMPSNSENIPPSGFINRTPTRISTISSLMDQTGGGGGGGSKKWKSQNGDDYENSYRSAGGIDDYPSPLAHNFEMRSSRPISPMRTTSFTQEFQGQSEQNVKMSFGEKLQKGYKDVTEFKLKHLFAKRTVVHTDKIEITDYIQSFDEDRRREERVQQKRDNEIADNYKFQFKISKQKSEESYIDDSPASSPQQSIEPEKKNPKTLSEQSGDESGMESSPPTRKPGIASTRFSRVRKTPLSMSLEDDGADDDDDDGDIELDVVDVDAPVIKPNSSSLRDSKKHQSSQKFTNSRQSSRRSTNTFSRDRPPPPPSRTPLNMSLEEELDDEENDDVGTDDNIELDVEEVATPKKIKPNTSTLYDIKKHKSPEKSTDLQQNPRKSKSIRERVSHLTNQKSEGDETNAVSEKKRRAPLSPQQSEENATTKSDKPFDTLKQNFKRMQKSVRLPQQMSMHSGAESENEDANSDSKAKLSKSQQFTERLKRFRSIDNVNKNPEDNENNESPMHKITNKLQDWRKSFRKKADPHNPDIDDGDEATSPQKQEKPVGSLMKKLKHIRSRKRDSIDDPDDDEEGGETYKESLAARAKFQLEKGVVVASQVPQITMKKISDTKKYFKKKQENEGKNKPDKPQSEEEDIEVDQQNTITKPAVKSIPRPPPPIPRPYFHNSSEEEDDDDDIDNHKFITKSLAESQLISVPTATAVWTTKPILSDDLTDYDEDLPRVLLHQDNSDVFESTLIIAVTRPISHTTTSPIITELPPDSPEQSTPDTKPDDWIPNQDMVATFLEVTPPSQRKLSRDSTNSRGHSRKHSIDSSSDDSWIKDIPKGPSTAVLNSVHENEDPWKIQKGNTDENLYKTKSIDLFEMQKKQGGVLCAFEDFDDELKNTPVVKIENENEIPVAQLEKKNANVVTIDTENTPVVAVEKEEPTNLEILRNIDNYERESSEELEYPDDDNSSRVTKISVHPQESKSEELQNPNDDNSSRFTQISVHPRETKDEELYIQDNGISSNVTKMSTHPQQQNSEELENPDNENSSRLTQISVHTQEPKTYEAIKLEPELKSKPFGNSRESLTGNLDDKDAIDSGEESDDDEDFQDSEDDQIEVDRPPSKTPSPPPSIASTPPPLPERKPSISQLISSQYSIDLPSLDCPSLPPPTMPTTKPPLPPKRPTPTTSPPPPPKIPDRNPPTTRISKPLVKTASLRLAYNEQVNPEDVGKVNKLISRFEPEGIKQRPKIIPRKPLITYESDDYSDEEDLMQLLPIKQRDKIRDMTPTNLPRMQKSFSIDSVDIPNNNDISTANLEIHTSLSRKAASQLTLDNCGNTTTIPSISISSNCLDVNSNFSQPSSVYGSPLAFPSSVVGSTEVTPLTNRKDSEHLGARRNRRSMARDDEHFYSFDSDEENSYYSIGSNSSNRYVVDL
ncbi:protein PIP82 [Calliphora vicina]|uniref:protein PIP82 n=1 Tax=Calliphora vicina TaxID=7373 RepID=UPI00325B2877